MGLQAIGAILNTVGQILESTAAFVTQSIQGAIAEQAVKMLRVHILVARKIFTFPVLEKFVIGHVTPLSMEIPGAVDG